MNRYEIIVRQNRNGTLHQCTAEVLAKTSTEAMRTGLTALNMKGGFTAVVRPFDKRGN